MRRINWMFCLEQGAVALAAFIKLNISKASSAIRSIRRRTSLAALSTRRCCSARFCFLAQFREAAMGTAIARTPTTMPTPMTIRLYKSSPSQIPFLDVTRVFYNTEPGDTAPVKPRKN